MTPTVVFDVQITLIYTCIKLNVGSIVYLLSQCCSVTEFKVFKHRKVHEVSVSRV